MEIVQLAIAAVLIIGGLLILALAVFGVFKFKYCLNRMHAAAMVDTLAALCILGGMAVLNGFTFPSLKLCLIIFILWMTSPVASHLVCQLEVVTNPEIEEECEVREL